jgi:hypothetical protein
MPHLPASALFFLLPFAAASHAQWQLHFRDDAPAASAEDQATLQRVQRLLKRMPRHAGRRYARNCRNLPRRNTMFTTAPTPTCCTLSWSRGRRLTARRC